MLDSFHIRFQSTRQTSHELRMRHGTDRISHCQSDGSGEFGWVCKVEGISHDKTQPGDAQSKGIAEGFVQVSKLGTTAALCQAGLPHPYWHWALLYNEVSSNITEHEGRPEKMPWRARFGEEFPGFRIPFGAGIKFVPPPASKHWTDKLPCRTQSSRRHIPRLGDGCRVQVQREIPSRSNRRLR